MIQAIGLTSNPRKELPPAVDDVSFEAHAGRVTALLGAPGAGKTTALRLMLELQRGRGITYFRGRPLHRIPHPAREVGVLLGDVPGHPARSVRGHLRMLCAASGVPAGRADEVLEAVGLVSLRDERLGTLSRGMDRRLGLACALLPDPHTLVLDDPARGLSPGERRWLHGMLRAHAAQGGTILCTTADPKEAARIADHVVTLDGGRAVADQDAADFSRTRLRPRVAVRSPHAARLSALLAQEARAARRSVEVVREGGNRLCVYGSTCADVGEVAFRHGIVVHQLADEIGDMGPGAGATRAEGGPGPVTAGTDAGGAQADGPGPHTAAPAPSTPHRASPAPTAPAPATGACEQAGPRPLTADARPQPPGAPAPASRRHPGVSARAGEPGSVPPTVPGDLGVPKTAPASVSERATAGPRPLTADARPQHPGPPAPASRHHPGVPARADTPGSVPPTAPGAPGAPKTAPATCPPATADAAPAAAGPGPATADAAPVTAASEQAVPWPLTSGAPPRHPASPAPASRQHPGAPARASAPGGPEAVKAAPEGSRPPSGAPPRRAVRAAGARGVAGRTHGPGVELPPPISVRSAPRPLRPVRYEIRRATGIGTGFVVGAAVLVVSAVSAVLLARIGHTPQPRLLAAWPRELPLPPAALGAGLLGALAFGDEFRHPALATDRGTVPRRLGLLTAKLLVASATALVLAALTVGCDAELLYLVYGPEVVEVPADWLPLSAGWLGLVTGCAWAGVLAAGVFRSTTAGLAAIVAVPLLVVPLVHRVLEGPAVRSPVPFAARLREGLPFRWPFGGERYLDALLRLLAQPVGGALTLSLAALLCAYLLTGLRSRVR